MGHRGADRGGPLNLAAPTSRGQEAFGRAFAPAIHRPFCFRTPAWQVRLALGPMAVLALGAGGCGRATRSRRLCLPGVRAGGRVQSRGLRMGLERESGLEPATFSLGGGTLYQLIYSPCPSMIRDVRRLPAVDGGGH
jgi:hypothetical protein